jgi:hypothetical protein
LSAQGKLSRSVKVIIIVYFVGVALIIAGQSVYGYASQRISELEAKLSPNLSVYEYGRIKGSLDWWQPALISIYGPISICLITAGVAVLVFFTGVSLLPRVYQDKKIQKLEQKTSQLSTDLVRCPTCNRADMIVNEKYLDKIPTKGGTLLIFERTYQCQGCSNKFIRTVKEIVPSPD